MENNEGGTDPTGKDVFDASQYEFFGNNMLGDFELGGLEYDEDEIPFPEIGRLGNAVDLAELEGIEFSIGSQEEDDLPGIDDLSSTFLQLNQVVSGPATAGLSGDLGLKESSSAAESAKEVDSANWVDPRAFGAESFHENRNLLSESYSSSTRITESNSLPRTFTYPEPHPLQRQTLQHQHSTEPILIPTSSFSSYLPHGGPSPYASPNPNSSYQHGNHQMPIASPNRSAFSIPQLQSTTLPHGSQFGAYFPQRSHGLSVNHQRQNHMVNQNSAYPRNQHIPSQHLSHQNVLITQQTIPPQYPLQNNMQYPHQQSSAHLRGTQPQVFSPHPSSPRMNNFGMLGLPNSSDPRAISIVHYPQQFSDSGGPRMYGGWSRFRAKYMAADEIENVIRMQLAATHTVDPYVEDYYHQASLARKSAGAKVRRRFCPTQLRNGSFVSSCSNEPHAFLRVDGLGRVALPSIRRPRPLLEVEPVNMSSSTSGDIKSELTEKPLEQEPMLSARLAIENGHYFLLEIDDIDRFLQCNQPQADRELRQRRQFLLEGLASSLQLVDPLGKNEATLNLAPKDDLVFMRIVSIIKGKKLLLRYLQLLSPGELLRVVCMAIFRNLRLLFCDISSDPETSATTVSLAQTVSSCVQRMDLKSLAACLASVVCSNKRPPLHPIGSSCADGASVVLKSVLERATEVLTSYHADGGCTPANRALWQASFDAFFGLVMEYCGNTYDSALQSFLSQSSPNHPNGIAVGSDMAMAIAREIPIELLRASLPHTNEQQKQIVLEFSRRSMPATGFSGGQS